MFEKVNPSHPDKLADRIAGAVVDLCYLKRKKPTCACEVLLGHGWCNVIIETNTKIKKSEVRNIVRRITGKLLIAIDVLIVLQDPHLRHAQLECDKCGDNGIFKGSPVTEEQKQLTQIAKDIYKKYPSDGKYLLDGSKLVICQSRANDKKIKSIYPDAVINPLGRWTGGIDVDTGATNRKLGSDMGDAVTGGGLHGKDLSKADVTLSIYCHIIAQSRQKPFKLSCNIGQDMVDGQQYNKLMNVVHQYILKNYGSFEKLAEWGLIK